jgi:hypothetical protein
MGEYSVDPSFSVWDDKEGVRIRVGCDPDTPEIIQISTPDKRDKEWYGDIRLTLSIEHAKSLVDAIQKQIKAIEEK